MLSTRSRLTFEQKTKSLQSTTLSCNIRNKVFCVLFVMILVIIVIFFSIYFDVASHSDLTNNETQLTNSDIIIENNNNNNINALSDTHVTSVNDDDDEIIYSDISITSRTEYVSTLEIEHANFLNLLHRRSLGFDVSTYEMMRTIINEYGLYANAIMSADIDSTNNGQLSGKYIIITPAAQMCNRMRAFMGAMILGILTRRVVFIDIGAEGYAARFNQIFIAPNYEWEFKSIDAKLKKKISSTGKLAQQKWIFPYEWLQKDRAPRPSGVIANQICSDLWINNDKSVWHIESHAAFLPLLARNEKLCTQIMNNFKKNENNEYKFDYLLANYFMSKIGGAGQQYIEELQVLLGRLLFALDDEMQNKADEIIRETYESAQQYYKSKNINYANMDEPPPVIGIHIRSEYVLLMSPKQCPGRNIFKCASQYNWYEQCGIAAMDKKYFKIHLGVKPYLFIAADTAESQQAAAQIFGQDRVFYRPFDKTGGSFEGIQQAVIDLITVSSFDVFVGTPHSSYSEMASILSQPRRIYDGRTNKFIYRWKYDTIDKKHLIPVNRMIIPMISTIGWEIDKLNLYTMGRTFDVNLDENNKILLPETKQNRPNYQKDKICKQQITAGMGWMGLFHMLKNVQCYDTKWHHPSPNWFPIANK